MSENLQYRRTHKEIIRAFLALAKKIPFDKMTVEDILQEALVSRYTFYKHFKDKYDIGEQLQKQLIEEFRAQKQGLAESQTPLSQEEQNSLWIQFAREHSEDFWPLWGIHTETIDLREQFRKEFRSDFLKENQSKDNGFSLNLEADICAGVQTTLMTYLSKCPEEGFKALGEPIKEIMIDSFIYLCRLQPADKIKKAVLEMDESA